MRPEQTHHGSAPREIPYWRARIALLGEPRRGPFRKLSEAWFAHHEEAVPFHREGIGYRRNWFMGVLAVGNNLEETAALLGHVTDEVREAKATYETLHHDVSALADVIQPQLLAQVKALRDSRMAVVREVQDSLAALREIRKFFLEEAHAVELARLERFVVVCRELQALKQTGVLDAVGDLVIRLALAEPKTP